LVFDRSFFLAFFSFPYLEFNPFVFAWLFGILLLSFLSTLHSVAIGTSLPFFLKESSAFLAAYLAFGLGKKRGMMQDLFLIFILGGLGVSACGYLFWILANSNFPYLTSTFYQSDVFGGYLLLLIPLSASLAVFSEDRIRIGLYFITTCFFILTLFFTYSRGAILSFLASGMIWGFFIYQKKPKVVRYSVVVLAFLSLFSGLYIFLAKKTALFLDFRNKILNWRSWIWNAGARFSFWRGALHIFAAHPWFGTGPDTFGKLFPLYQEKFYWYSRFPHNFYLQILSEQGIFSFLLIIGFIVMTLILSYWGLKHAKEEDFPFALGLFTAFLGGALHQGMDVDSNFLSWNLLFWIENGLLLSIFLPTFPWKKGLKFSMGIVVFLLLFFQVLSALGAFWDGQAAASEEKGEILNAIQDEKKALFFFPLEGNYWEHLARLELSLYQTAKKESLLLDAKANLEKAFSLDSTKPTYLGELAGIETHLPGGRKKAILLLQRAIGLDPLNYPEHYLRLADLEEEEGKTQTAKALYQHVIALYPRQEVNHLMFFRKEDFVNAVALAHLGLAKIDLNQKKLKEAKDEIQKALAWSSSNPQVAYYAGLFSLYDSKWKDAVSELETAVYDPSLSENAWKWLALAQLRLKKADLAMKALKKAIQLNPYDASLYTLAGNIYALNKESREAQQMWQKSKAMTKAIKAPIEGQHPR
jgi:O-antigen ligase/predicted negative regulator of RcsB-dependent stress response